MEKLQIISRKLWNWNKSMIKVRWIWILLQSIEMQSIEILINISIFKWVLIFKFGRTFCSSSLSASKLWESMENLFAESLKSLFKISGSNRYLLVESIKLQLLSGFLRSFVAEKICFKRVYERMGQGWTSLVGECQFTVNNKYTNVQKFYSCVFIAGFKQVFDHLV